MSVNRVSKTARNQWKIKENGKAGEDRNLA